MWLKVRSQKFPQLLPCSLGPGGRELLSHGNPKEFYGEVHLGEKELHATSWHPYVNWLLLVFVHDLVTWERGTLAEELPLSDWAVTMSVTSTYE